MAHITLKLKIKESDITSEQDDVIENIKQLQSKWERHSYNVCINEDIDPNKSVNTLINEVKKHIKQPYPKGYSWLQLSAYASGVEKYKIDKQQKHFKPRVFGSKKELTRRSKHLISNEEWKQRRLTNIRSIGDTQLNGNRKVDFLYDSIIFKPNRNNNITYNVYRPKGSHGKIYDAILDKIEQNQCPPITVEFVKDQIHLTVDTDKLNLISKKYNPIPGRYAGIDNNPNYIGITYFDEKHNLLDKRLYNLHHLTGKNVNQNKLKHERNEILHEIGRLASNYKIEYIFIEDLKSLQIKNHKRGKYYNRLVNNQFIRSNTNHILSKYTKVVELNAAYTTTIGNIMHPDESDPIASAMEIARRGIESRVIKGSEKFYPNIPSMEYLSNLWKKEIDNDVFGSWIDIHNWIKQRDFGIRVPIPPSNEDVPGMYRFFGHSNRSKILILNNDQGDEWLKDRLSVQGI